MSEDDNQIKITIFGQEYSVKAPADPTYIKKSQNMLIAKCVKYNLALVRLSLQIESQFYLR